MQRFLETGFRTARLFLNATSCRLSSECSITARRANELAFPAHANVPAKGNISCATATPKVYPQCVSTILISKANKPVEGAADSIF